MHLEFLPLIELSLQRSLPEIAARFPEELGRVAVERMQSLSEIDVADCPEYIGSAITTNLPFIVCSMLEPLGAKEREVNPIFVGELLIKNVPEAGPYFNMSLGGPGFINAHPSNGFIDLFLERACAEQSKYLFSRSSFVLKRADETPLEPFRAKLKQLKELQLKRLKNEDLEILEAHIRSKGSADADDVLMYLALLADPEIDSGSYLHKVGSSENVPWFLRRFFFDVRRASAKWKHAASAVSSSEFSQFRNSPAGRLSAPLTDKLLHLRYIYQNARKRRRPELHLGFVLSIVRTWYTVFNRPECRRLLGTVPPEHPTGAEEARGLCALSRLIESVVQSTRENLEFCCDSTDFVLNIGPSGS